MRLLVIAAIFLTACVHRAEPPVAPLVIPVDPTYAEEPVVDGLGSPAGNACRNLRNLGCPEGFKDGRTGKTCYQRLEHEAELVKIPYACFASAKSRDAAQRCGTKDTLRVRCALPSVDASSAD